MKTRAAAVVPHSWHCPPAEYASYVVSASIRIHSVLNKLACGARRGMCALIGGHALSGAQVVSMIAFQLLVGACLLGVSHRRLRHILRLRQLSAAVFALAGLFVAWLTWAAQLHRCSTRCDIVVAHCDENVNWLIDASRFNRRVFIYTKCNSTLSPKLRSLSNVIVRRLPNVGSCDFAYLTHITKHYARLPEVVLFCKGSAPHCNTGIVQRPSSLLVRPPPYAYVPTFGWTSTWAEEGEGGAPLPWRWFARISHRPASWGVDSRPAVESFHLHDCARIPTLCMST